MPFYKSISWHERDFIHRMACIFNMAFMRSENKKPECHDLESLDIDIDIVAQAFLQYVIVFLKLRMLRLSSSSCVFSLTCKCRYHVH